MSVKQRLDSYRLEPVSGRRHMFPNHEDCQFIKCESFPEMSREIYDFIDIIRPMVSRLQPYHTGSRAHGRVVWTMRWQVADVEQPMAAEMRRLRMRPPAGLGNITLVTRRRLRVSKKSRCSCV